MDFIIKDKSFYSKVFAIAIPMALQNLINVGVSLLDTVMLGQLGEVAMSASSLAGQVGFTYMIMNLGLTAGAGVLTSQYWGRKDPVSIRKVLTMTYRISMLFAAVFTIVSLLFPVQIMNIFTNDAQVIESGAIYVRVMAFSYFAHGFTMTSYNILRTVGTVKIAMYTYAVSFFVNAFLTTGLFSVILVCRNWELPVLHLPQLSLVFPNVL